MRITSFHEIDPNGDVDLILTRSEEVDSHLASVLECTPTPSSLNFRHPKKRQVSEPEISIFGEPLTHEGPFLDPVPEPVPDAPEPDVPFETFTNSSDEALTAPKKHFDSDVLVKEDAYSTSNKSHVQIRTSSKHLILASSYFKRNLESKMSESRTLSSQGHVEFSMDEKDPEAMLLIMNIIHGHTRQVPRSVDLDMLTKLAILVDYLECHEVVEPFSDRWIDELKENITITYSKALIQWLCISLIFRKTCQFKTATRMVIRHARDPMQTLGLPIWETVVEKINQQRSDAFVRLFLALEKLLDDFRHDRTDCTFECNAMQYGMLAKELSGRELLLRPQAPFLGYSLEDTVASIREIQDPQWWSRASNSRANFSSSCEPHTCKLTTHITSVISSVYKNVEGLSLRDDL